MSEQLRERLFQQIEAKPGSSIMALLDLNHPVAESDELHLQWLNKRQSKPELAVVRRHDYAHDHTICPRLMLLRSPRDRGYSDEALLDITWKNAQRRRISINGAYVCGWLVTQASLKETAAQLRSNTLMHDPLRRKQKVLPLFEPHRMALAMHLAPPQWVSRWMGDISLWLFVDACGQLREVTSAPVDATAAPVELPNEFWAAQGRLRRAREVLMALAKAEHMVPVDCEIKIDQALSLAYAQGLIEIEDVIFFAMNQLTLSKRWYLHPSVTDCLARARAGDQSLADGIEALPDHVLDELVEGGDSIATRNLSKEAKEWPVKIQ